jgi:hypothetical protein
MFIFSLNVVYSQSESALPSIEEIGIESSNDPGEIPSVEILGGALGPGDCVQLLMKAEAQLMGSASSRAPEQLDGTIVLIEQIIDYCDFMTQNLAGVIQYKWVRLGRPQADPRTRDIDNLRIETPIPGVTAIRFSTLVGQIRVFQFTISDEMDRDQVFPLDWVLPDKLPKHHLLRLDNPVTLGKAQITHSHEGDGKGRTQIEAGIPDRPEYSFHAARLCRKSVENIKDRQITEAVLTLIQARKLLEEFNANLDDYLK